MCDIGKLYLYLKYTKFFWIVWLVCLRSESIYLVNCQNDSVIYFNLLKGFKESLVTLLTNTPQYWSVFWSASKLIFKDVDDVP